LDRALERDPEKRFSSAAEFSDAVMGLVPQLAETVSVPLADLPPETGPGGPFVPEAARVTAPPIVASPSREAPAGNGRFSWKSPAVILGGVGGALVLCVGLFFLLGGWDLFGGAPFSGGTVFSVSPTSAFLTSGDSMKLTASRGGADTEAGSLDVRWASQDPGVARVGASGTVIGGRVGATSVLAILGGDTVRVAVQVASGPPARVTLVPPSLRLIPGRSEQLGARVTDAQDNLILDPGLQWSSSVPGVADVDGFGLVRARAAGSAVIRAEIADAWNQVTVEVRGSTVDPRPPQAPEESCPDPVMEVLDRLEVALDDPSVSRQELRDGVLACWNRGEALSDEERAYAAWLMGLNTVNLEGCSQAAILWLDRAVQLEPGSEAYRVARQACGGKPG
jgi:hypothetical protein